MRFGFGRLGSFGGAHGGVVGSGITTLASAVITSLTSVNSWAGAAGQGGDLLIGESAYIKFALNDDTWNAREDIWGYQATTSDGWILSHSAGTLSLVCRGTGGTTRTITSNLLVGEHCVVFTRVAANTFRIFFDGNATVIVSGAVTYTPAGASGIQFVGFNPVENTGACVAIEVFDFGMIGAELSDAEGIAISNTVNTANRWDIPAAVAAHASVTSVHSALGWDGSSSTWVASLGSSPKTLTKRGTGGTRVALPAMKRIEIGADKLLDNEFYTFQATPVPHYISSLFSNTEFSHAGSRMWLEAISTQNPSFGYQCDLGLTVDGVQVQTSELGGLGGVELFPPNKICIRDAPIVSATTHSYTITNGLQSGPSPLVGTWIQAIWVPVTENPTFTPYAAPARRLVLGLSDSTCEQLGSAGSTVTTPTTDAWIMRLRASLKALGVGWRVSVKAYGSGAFGDFGKTSGGRQGLADGAASMLDGTTKNVLYNVIGRNDWALNVYTVIGTFSSDYDDYLTKLDAACAAKPGIVKRGITPFWDVNQANLNASGAGFSLITLRSTQTTLYTAHSWLVTDGLTLITPTTGFGDGVHPLPGNPGHAECAALVAAFAELQTADVTAPTLSTAIIPSNGLTLALTYSETLDSASVPLAGAFSLSGTARTVASVGVSGAVVTLTLSGAVAQGATVTVSYTPGGAPIQDVAGNDAASLSSQAVTNNSTVDATAPTLSSAVIGASGTTLTLTYNEALDASSDPATGAYSLAGTASAITAVDVTGSTVLLTLSPAVLQGVTGIALNYTPGGAPVQDVAGNDAAALSSQAVTNNSTATGGSNNVIDGAGNQVIDGAGNNIVDNA